MDINSQEFYALPFEARQAARKAASAKVSEAAAQAEERSRKPRTRAETVVDVLESRIAEVASRYNYDGVGAKTRHLNLLKSQLKEAKAKVQLEQRAADFSADPLVTCAQSTFESVSRSGESLFPGSSAEDRALLCALWERKEQFATPEEFLSAFNETYNKITTASWQHADKVATDEAHEALRLQMESAQANLEAAKAKQRMETQPGD